MHQICMQDFDFSSHFLVLSYCFYCKYHIIFFKIIFHSVPKSYLVSKEKEKNVEIFHLFRIFLIGKAKPFKSLKMKQFTQNMYQIFFV